MEIAKLTGADDKRIGTKATAENPVKWPELDITGNPYTLPATTYGIPGKRGLFVVLPMGFNMADVDQITFEAARRPASKPE